MNKTVRRILLVFASLILVIALALGSLLLPSVQSYIGRKVSEAISRNIPQQVSIDRIDIRTSGRVCLSGIRVLDHHGDTLIAADSVKARLGLSGIFSGKLSLAYADIYRPELHIIKYKGEEKNSLALFIDNFKSEKKKEKKPFYLSVSKAEIFNGDFSFERQDSARTEYARHISLKASGISIDPGDYHADLDALSFASSAGTDVRNFSGTFRLCPQGIIMDKVTLATDRSNLQFSASSYFLRGDSAGIRLIDRIRNSQFSLSLEPSHIDMHDVEHLFPQAAYVPPTDISARIVAEKGMVDVKGLKVAIGDVFSANISGRLNAPGALRDGNGKIVLKSIQVLPSQAIAVMNRVTGKYVPEKTYDKLSSIEQLSGNALVTLENENVTAVVSLMTLQHGKIFIQGQSDDLWNKKNARYTAKAVLENVNAGLLTGSKLLGKVTLFSDIKGKGFDPRSATIELNTSIHLLEFKGYPYTGIDLYSKLADGALSSEITVADPNLQAKLSASLEGTPEKGRYHGTLDMYLDKSDLHALNLVKDSIVNLRGTIQADATGSGLNDVEGMLSFSEMSYNNGSNYYYLDRILIESQILDSAQRRLSIDSDELFNGYIEGNYLLSEVPSAVMNGLLARFKPYQKRKVTPGQEYSFQLNITASNVKIVNTPLVFDGKTHMGGTVNTSQDDFSFNLVADRINYNNILLDTLNFNLNTANANVLSIKAQKFLNPVYSIEDLDLSAQRYADSIAIRSDFYKWNSADSIAYHIKAYQKDDEDGNVVIGFLPSNINLEHMKWQFGGHDPSRDRIVWNVDQGSVNLDSLVMTSGEARISAGGFYSSKDLMDLRLSIEELDLSRSIFLRNNVPLKGHLNLLAHLYKGEQDKTIIPEVSLSIDSLAVAYDEIGDLSLSVKADLANRYINTSAQLVNGSRKALSLTGGLRISDRQLVPEMDLTLDSLRLDVVHYLLPSVFNKSTGFASAEIEIRGLMKSPDINGFVRLDRTKLGINFTNVEYAIPDSTIVPVRNSFFYFDKIRIRDVVYSTYGTLDGRIYHDNFKPWYLDLRTDVDKTLVLNTSGQNNDKFYGKVFATGFMELKGPTNSLKYNIAARTERNTNFAIDIGSASDFKDSQMITFVPPRTSHVDSLLQNLKKQIVKSAVESSSEMDIAIEATPDATLSVYLDKTSGHMIEANGEGKLSMHLSPQGSFTLNGTYEVVSGNYTFVYKMIKKSFSLLSGGRMTFDGDPSNPNIDISASYKTTTKPAVYLSSVAENAREEVVMTINLTGDLTEPVYNFDIQMPRAPENVREELAYRLSDQDQLSQQFISLMVLNSFTATGENDNQNVVASGVAGLTAGMLSSQFSNILQRFVSGVDINVNVNTSTNKYLGTTESTDFELGISTKLFDNRVTVNGMVGMPTGTTQSDLVGDVEIEYNITPDGRFRAVFVNRRQNDYMNNQQGYIQSIGVSYRQEFNTFRELGSLIKQSFTGKNAAARKKAKEEKKLRREAEKNAESFPTVPVPSSEQPPKDTIQPLKTEPADTTGRVKITFK